ncbi:MAG TPA: DUF3352 domain-containing protein [Candidatus Limnocylindria bacterium]|nr:DUF3352 domain-containing protein [Candidatus Limnocylindria bacterium]
MTDDVTRPIETSGLEAAPPSPANEAAVAPSADPAALVPGADPAAATPSWNVVGDTPVASSAGRGRWIVALGVAGAAIALTVGALFLLGGRSSPEALKYIPNDAAVVAELRLDLPGDQLQKAGNLLAHFPGFQDQSTFGDKIDEALSRFVSEATESGADYRGDIKPWLNGPAFVGLMAPAAGSGGVSVAGMEHRTAVLSATTNGGVSCATTFAGQTVSHQQHGGYDLTISADGELACVVDGRQALLGDPATVGRALDAKAAGTGMDRSDRYRTARAALGGDRIATVFVNGAAARDLVPDASALPLPSGLPSFPGMGSIGEHIPDWLIAGVRAENDSLILDNVAAQTPVASGDPSLLPLPASHASVLAPVAPASALVFVEHQGAGVSIQNLLAGLRATPELAAPLQMLEGAGGAGPLVSWVEDVGVVVTMDGTDPRVAALLVAADATAAKNRLATIAGLLAIGALTGGVTQEKTTIAGIEVTTVTIADLAALAPPGTVPGAAPLPSTGPISFSLAAKDRLVILASSPAAMAGILQVQPGQALADQAAFKLVSQRGLANSRTTGYVAAGAAFAVIKPFLSAGEAAAWDAEYAPYLDPIEAAGITTTSDGAANRSRVVITVTGP